MTIINISWYLCVLFMLALVAESAITIAPRSRWRGCGSRSHGNLGHAGRSFRSGRHQFQVVPRVRTEVATSDLPGHGGAGDGGRHPDGRRLKSARPVRPSANRLRLRPPLDRPGPAFRLVIPPRPGREPVAAPYP